MSAAPAFSSYNFDGRDELCLMAGADHEVRVLLIPPLFDEMNRMRHMLVDVMMLLDDRGIGSLLPDLPGSNESLFPQDQASLTVWKDALTACAGALGHPARIASFRGGCLVDSFAQAGQRWRLTPAKGSSLLRTMMRTRIASDKEMGLTTSMAELTEAATSQPILLAGNRIGPAMFAELQEAKPAETGDFRVARLETDSQPADARLAGSALWLRAEPDADSVLSRAIADDLASWVQS